ncbi:hypothetical protein [Alkalibacter saccharofermentans]|uniref:Uncharacterized protein n=1 Tax=Alkalibacter saccharofermentans DSM 14828 TaxID=1120975 RepID=A0A1M4X9L3_9FIRM|nr:hypothetical protein [Alkalibacter saccharofermentans]SHE90208.1 hypothetical protein SAMN02746064_01445 [Alkalibacter saccharofermentans DSM 14828]
MNELEFVLNKIIDMDTRAKDVKNEAEEKQKFIEEATKEKIKEIENSMLDESKNKLDRIHLEEMNNARLEAKKILDEADVKCEKIEAAYSKSKIALRDRIVKEILNGSKLR